MKLRWRGNTYQDRYGQLITGIILASIKLINWHKQIYNLVNQ